MPVFGIRPAQVHAADEHCPLGRVREPGDESSEGRLARSGLAHHRDVGVRGHGRIDPVQHRGVGDVGEPHISHLQRERAFGQAQAAVRLGFGYLYGHVQHFQDLPPSRQGGLGLVEDLPEFGYGNEQQAHQEDERHPTPPGSRPRSVACHAPTTTTAASAVEETRSTTGIMIVNHR